MPKIQMTYTILRDTAEKRAIVFPPSMLWRPRGRKTSIRIATPTIDQALGRGATARGDYGVRELGNLVGIERKASLSELNENVTKNKLQRQLKALRDNVKYPYLFLDFTLADLGPHYRDPHDRSVVILDTVFSLAHKYRIPLLGPMSAKGNQTRLICGEMLARIMLSHST